MRRLRNSKCFLMGIYTFTLTTICLPLSAIGLSLSDAIELAQQRDSAGTALQYQATAAIDQGIALGQLPDPKLKVALNNMPTDSFNYSAEPMTMLSVGISQMFPAGSTLALQKDLGDLRGEAIQFRADARKHQVLKATRQHWYQVYYWQNALARYTSDKAQFDQLLAITRSHFSVGKNKQQDVLRAELEISRLEERLLTAANTLQEARAGLARWIGEQGLHLTIANNLELLPEIIPLPDDLNMLAQNLSTHPELRSYSVQISESETQVAIAEEAFKPTWNLDLSYGFRAGENPDNSNRTDFASVMVNLSLPALNSTKQDKALSAKKALSASGQANYVNALREQTLKYRQVNAQWQQMQQRRKLFESALLSQSAAQTEATLKSYQSDAADFSEVMRAYLSDQQIQLDYEFIRMREQILLAELHYFTATTENERGSVQ